MISQLSAVSACQRVRRLAVGPDGIFLCAVVFFCAPAGPMTLTRGSFSYSNGEEYHGEWKEGKADLLAHLSNPHPCTHTHTRSMRTDVM